MGRGSTCFDHKNIARIANAVQCHSYCQVTMIVIVSVVLKVLGGGRIPGVRIKWKQLEFGKHIIIMLYFLKYSIHIKYLIRKIFGAKKCLNQRLHFVKD